MRMLRGLLLLPACMLLHGCAGLAQTSADVGESLSAATEATAEVLRGLLKSTPYDAPGTRAPVLSPEVSAALTGVGVPDADPGTVGDIRLYRIEQAQAQARSDYDRVWLQFERAQTLAMLARCEEARAEFAPLAVLETPSAEQLAADAALRRIALGVCWNTQPWSGYRFRPAPPYPTRPGHPPIEGEVELLLHVNHRGGVSDVVVIQSSHKVLELQTLLKVREWRFQPLRVDGVRIPFTLRQKLRFQYPQIYVDD